MPITNSIPPNIAIMTAMSGVYEIIFALIFTFEHVWETTFDTAGMLHAIWARLAKGAVLMAQKYIKIPSINNINPSMIVLPPASIVDLKKGSIVYLMLVSFAHVVGFFRGSYLTGYIQR